MNNFNGFLNLKKLFDLLIWLVQYVILYILFVGAGSKLFESIPSLLSNSLGSFHYFPKIACVVSRN